MSDQKNQTANNATANHSAQNSNDKKANDRNWQEKVMEGIAGDNTAMKGIVKFMLSIGGFLTGLGLGYWLFGREKDKQIAELKEKLNEQNQLLRKQEHQIRELDRNARWAEDENKDLKRQIEANKTRQITSGSSRGFSYLD